MSIKKQQETFELFCQRVAKLEYLELRKRLSDPFVCSSDANAEKEIREMLRRMRSMMETGVGVRSWRNEQRQWAEITMANYLQIVKKHATRYWETTKTKRESAAKE